MTRQTESGNMLYYGDNLDILRRYIPDESVDLVYLDPPFNSNATYNILFAEQDGNRAAAQIKAFGDTWQWDQAAIKAHQEIVEAGGKASIAMQSFRQFLGDNNMLAYLSMMAPRLLELRRVLKSTGSIYLHCDPTASHYLKMLMDAVFEAGNFGNEIIWNYGARATVRQSGFPGKHDVLFRYTKTSKCIFNKLFVKYKDESMGRYNKVDGQGRRYALIKRTRSATGETYYGKCYPSEGAPMTDVWSIPTMASTDKERLGYPTQKPEALLERIIKASSNEGDVVLDPFCGCGTTIAVAQRLKRRWIGIDITQAAMKVIKVRLRDAFGDAVQYEIIGEPVSVPDAQVLADTKPYQFQWWALGLAFFDARPAEGEGKKGADKGVDGRGYFHDEPQGGKTKQIVFSVKAGHTNVAHVRDLRGVLERDKAEIGVLLTMQEPTRPMRAEAAGAGFYDSPWGTRHPKMQIITVGQLLEGKMVDMPPSRDVRTFKKARRIKHRRLDTPPFLQTE